jgi:hypothetical protein
MGYALRRPLALVVTILLVHLVLPSVTYLISSLIFGFGSPTVAGVVLEYSVPIGASSVMWVGMFSGEIALGLSALLVSTMLSPFTIPATMKLLVGASVEIEAMGMMTNMAFMVALPALLASLAIGTAPQRHQDEPDIGGCDHPGGAGGIAEFPHETRNQRADFGHCQRIQCLDQLALFGEDAQRIGFHLVADRINHDLRRSADQMSRGSS